MNFNSIASGIVLATSVYQHTFTTIALVWEHHVWGGAFVHVHAVVGSFHYNIVLCRGENERDVFNEKPSKEEQMAATQVSHVGVDI